MSNLDDFEEALRQALNSEAEFPFGALAAELRKLTAGRRHTPAEELLRESRDAQ